VVFLKRELNELTVLRTSPHYQTGVDLTSILLRFAQELKGTTKHVTMISLGRGQAAKAEELMATALAKGQQWVFLQNCHLAASFMPRLCAVVES
jgi:dynein heavy chain